MLWSLFSNPLPADQSSDFFSILSAIGAIVAIPFAIIAAITAILAFRQQQYRKEFTYQIISNAPIVSVNKSLGNRVKVLLDNKEVKDARLLVIKIWNSGNQSIESKDYFEPIKFHFDNGTVLSCEVLETYPQNLLDSQSTKTLLKTSNVSIELSRFPLNSRDSITFKILSSGNSDIKLSGRINQGQIIDYRDNVSKNLSRSRIYAIIISGILVIITLIQAILYTINGNNSIFVITQPVILFVLLIYLYNSRRRQKFMKDLKKNE